MAVFIMLNNYFHDLATAMMACSALVIFILVRYAENQGTEATRFFIGVYPKLTKIARFSLAWIFWGGVIRTFAYTKYEWSDAAGRDQVPSLIAKHILIFIVVGIGIYLWVNLSKRVKVLKQRLDHGEDVRIAEKPIGTTT